MTALPWQKLADLQELSRILGTRQVCAPIAWGERLIILGKMFHQVQPGGEHFSIWSHGVMTRCRHCELSAVIK